MKSAQNEILKLQYKFNEIFKVPKAPGNRNILRRTFLIIKQTKKTNKKATFL